MSHLAKDMTPDVTWKEITPGCNIFEGATSAVVETGDWRTITLHQQALQGGHGHLLCALPEELPHHAGLPSALLHQKDGRGDHRACRLPRRQVLLRPIQAHRWPLPRRVQKAEGEVRKEKERTDTFPKQKALRKKCFLF